MPKDHLNDYGTVLRKMRENPTLAPLWRRRARQRIEQEAAELQAECNARRELHEERHEEEMTERHATLEAKYREARIKRWQERRGMHDPTTARRPRWHNGDGSLSSPRKRQQRANYLEGRVTARQKREWKDSGGQAQWAYEKERQARADENARLDVMPLPVTEYWPRGAQCWGMQPYEWNPERIYRAPWRMLFRKNFRQHCDVTLVAPGVARRCDMRGRPYGPTNLEPRRARSDFVLLPE